MNWQGMELGDIKGTVRMCHGVSDRMFSVIRERTGVLV